MLIEIYKGIQIIHDASHDIFNTNIVVNKKFNGKKEFISSPRLQKVRDEIDRYLNTNSTKPVIKFGWLKNEDYNRYSTYEKVELISYNPIVDSITYKKISDGKIGTADRVSYYRKSQVYISCKENDEIISAIKKKTAEIEKISKSFNCNEGKLIPVKEEHFKK